MAHNSLFPFWRESAQFKFACLLDRIDRIFESSSSMGSAQGGGTRLTEAQRLDIIHELGRPDHRSRAAIAASYGVTPKAVRPPHLMDAAELSVQAWDAISSESIKNCFVKANIGVDYSDRNLETRVNALSGEMMSLLLAEFD